MITLQAYKIKTPIRAYINAVTDKCIYFGGENYEWIQLESTPILRNDIIQALNITRPMLWKHGFLELYSDGANIRARKPKRGKVRKNEHNNIRCVRFEG